MLNKKIIEICNLGLSNEKTIELVEKAIAESLPYDHEASDSRAACCVVPVTKFDLDLSATTQSMLVQEIESKFTKRELAFFLHHITWRVSQASHKWLFGWLFRLLFRS